jgi:hypothetical protein
MCVDTTSSSESNSSVACTHRSRCLASRAHEAYTRVHRKDYPPMGPTSALAAPSVPAWQELGCTLWIARESRPLRKYNQASGQLAPLVQPEGKTSEVLCGSRETAKKIRLTTLPASGHWERPIDVLLYPVSETPRPAPCIDNKRKSSRNDLMCVVPSESRRGNYVRVSQQSRESRIQKIRSRRTSPSASLLSERYQTMQGPPPLVPRRGYVRLWVGLCFGLCVWSLSQVLHLLVRTSPLGGSHLGA